MDFLSVRPKTGLNIFNGVGQNCGLVFFLERLPRERVETFRLSAAKKESPRLARCSIVSVCFFWLACSFPISKAEEGNASPLFLRPLSCFPSKEDRREFLQNCVTISFFPFPQLRPENRPSPNKRTGRGFRQEWVFDSNV